MGEIEKRTIHVRQFNRPKDEGVLHVREKRVAVALSSWFLTQYLTLGHIAELARELRQRQCSAGFIPLELRLIMIEGDPNTTDEEGIGELANLFAGHFTAGMVGGLISKLPYG